jgi:predicted dehydrogenase
MGAVHARAVLSAGHVVKSVAASSHASALEAAVRLGAQEASSTAEELIADPNIDVVHICTPNERHAAFAAAAIAAGKAVICEKPLATSVADAEGLLSSAVRSGVVTGVPFIYRYYPTVREARDRIARGDSGGLWMMHGRYLQDWLSSNLETNWRVDPSLGGQSRAFSDIGVHWCDLMEFTTGHRITRVVARMSHAHDLRPDAEGMGPVKTEDGAALLFETDRGAIGSLVVSQVSPGYKNSLWFSFDGTEASYRFDQESPESLWIGHRRENRVVARGADTLSTAGGQAYSRLPAGHPQGYQDCFNAFVSDVYDSLSGPVVEGLPTFADGHRAAVITAAVIDSMKNDSWVEVSP